MDLKKSYMANLEKKMSLRLIVGLCMTLSLILIGFEWTSPTTGLTDVNDAAEILFDEEMIPVTRRDQPSPPSQPELPPVAEVIILVDEDPEIDPVFWDTEIQPGMGIVIPVYPTDSGEEVVEPDDHIVAEIMPRFNGGDPNVEFFKYIHEHVVYPAEAVENRLSGKVTVTFVVNHEGYIERARILKGVHPVLDNEALRVVNASPRWEPGFQSGNYVNVVYSFPISFELH